MLINKKSKSASKAKGPAIKQIKSQTITKSALKEAYQLVINDLFQTFLKARDGQAIRLANIGTFTKNKSQMVSHLDGNAYRFYKMGFRMSSSLKKVLDQQLS